MRARVVVFWLAVAALLLPALLLTFTRLVEPRGASGIRSRRSPRSGCCCTPPRWCWSRSGSLVLRRWRTAGAPGRRWSPSPGSCLHAGGTRRRSPAPTRRRRTGADADRGDDRQPARRAAPTASRWSARRPRRTSTCWWSRRSTPRSWPTWTGPGCADLLPYRVGSPGPGAAGTMAFSPAPTPGRRAGADRTSAAGASRMGDLTVARGAPVPAAPTPTSWYADQAVDRPRRWPTASRTWCVGDFNATADHAPMRALADAGLPRRRASWPTTAGSRPGRRRGVFDVLGPAARADRPRPGRRAAGRARA